MTKPKSYSWREALHLALDGAEMIHHTGHTRYRYTETFAFQIRSEAERAWGSFHPTPDSPFFDSYYIASEYDAWKAAEDGEKEDDLPQRLSRSRPVGTSPVSILQFRDLAIIQQWCDERYVRKV